MMGNYIGIKTRTILFISLLLTLSCVHTGSAQSVNNNEFTVNGQVTDSTSGKPLIGVSILVKGTAIGATTDTDGNYSLIVPSRQDTLRFSYIGYTTKTVPINGRSTINLQMLSKTIRGKQMVVIGYGKKTKESLVGAVSVVKGEKLVKAAASTGNLMTSLQGEIPGLTVISLGEQPGESRTQIQIRAGASMGSTTPLFIVDGVARPSISNLDPINIESVSVLKGAAATAVYGINGANGVIIINTKRGQQGDFNLSFSSLTTLKKPARLPKFMNAYQTMKLRNEAYKNDGEWDKIISQDVLMHYKKQDLPYLYPSFNWQEYLWKPAINQKFNLNASGGSEFVQYYASLSLLRQGDIFNSKDIAKTLPYKLDASYKSKKYTFRTNLDFHLTHTTEFSTQLSEISEDINSPRDYYTQELMFEPVTALPYYPLEALKKYPDAEIPFNQNKVRPYINPNQGTVRLLWLGGEGVIQQRNNAFNVNLVLSQDLQFLTRGLGLQLRYSHRSFQNYSSTDILPNYYGYRLIPLTPDGSKYKWVRYTNTGAVDLSTPQPKLTINPTKSLTESNVSNYFRTQINYKRNFFGVHNVGFTGLFSMRKTRIGVDFPHYNEDLVGRITYNYKSTYFLDASLAYTGSEKFARGRRFGTFPSIGGAWKISNEDFFQSALPWFSLLKFKYSWGKIGSDAGIPRWLYRTSYQPNSGSVIFGYTRQARPFISEGPVPAYATWATAIKQNFGINMGFLNNQVTFNVSFYQARRENMLMARNSVPTWVGITGDIYSNIGEAKAHGIEIKLGLNKTMNNGFNVNFNGNFTIHESRVVNWDESNTIPFNLRAEGKPTGLAKRMNYFTPTSGVQAKGFYQNFDQLFMWPLASGPQPIVGDMRFLDFNGDGVINKKDMVVASHPFVPSYTWNANVGFKYKGFALNLVFYGISSVNFPLRSGGMFFLYPFTQDKDEALKAHANHWTPNNRDALFPAVHSRAQNQYNYRISSFSVLNGKYITLKRAILSYNIPAKLLNTMGIGVRQVLVSLTGVNLWLQTKLPFGGDPEGANYGQDFGSYPISKRFSLRVQIKF